MILEFYHYKAEKSIFSVYIGAFTPSVSFDDNLRHLFCLFSLQAACLRILHFCQKTFIQTDAAQTHVTLRGSRHAEGVTEGVVDSRLSQCYNEAKLANKRILGGYAYGEYAHI